MPRLGNIALKRTPGWNDLQGPRWFDDCHAIRLAFRGKRAIITSKLESRENRESSWKPSGFGLAQKKAQYWAVVNGDDVFMADVNKLAKLIKKQRRELQDHVSRRNLESRDKRMYARGYLLPLVDLESCCSVICPSPVNAPED